MGKTFYTVYPDVTRTDWYLTVRCTNFSCQGLIAFQKSEFPGDNPNLRIRVTGAPSVYCPHCNALVHFGLDQIEHKRVAVTGRAFM